jgi:hypothetical protein
VKLINAVGCRDELIMLRTSICNTSSFKVILTQSFDLLAKHIVEEVEVIYGLL